MSSGCSHTESVGCSKGNQVMLCFSAQLYWLQSFENFNLSTQIGILIQRVKTTLKIRTRKFPRQNLCSSNNTVWLLWLIRHSYVKTLVCPIRFLKQNLCSSKNECTYDSDRWFISNL